MTKKYYTLMYNDYFIDVDKLNKGLFTTNRPTYMPIELTHERIKEDWIEKIIMNGANSMFLNNFEKNWDKCILRKIKIIIE